MPPLIDRIQTIVDPLLDDLGLELIDLEHGGGVLRVLVDRPDRRTDDDGVDLDGLAAATRAISRALDDADPIPGRYTLEVSSPGLERRLRTPAHFARAVGSLVSVKLGPRLEGQRRFRGTLVSFADDTLTLLTDEGHEQALALADVEKAQTIFEWKPTPKPGGPKGTARPARTGADTPPTDPSDDPNGPDTKKVNP